MQAARKQSCGGGNANVPPAGKGKKKRKAQAEAQAAAQAAASGSKAAPTPVPPLDPDEIIYADQPSVDEVIQPANAHQAAWAAFCQALLGSAEFRYLR